MLRATQKTILLVEDEEAQREILEYKFTHEGFRVLTAKNGVDGLATALREQPDVILVDIIMPKMDGVTMMNEVRKDKAWGATVPVIMLTNVSADNTERLTGVASIHPVFYLIKTNWSMQELVRKVKEILAVG